MKRLLFALVFTTVLLGLSATPALAKSTAEFLDREFFADRDTAITGNMVVNSWHWYEIDVLPQLVILAAETSLGDRVHGGQLARENNFGCLRYHGADTKWGSLSDGRVWVKGKDWYSFPSAEIGIMAFGRYLRAGADGLYRRCLDDLPYDWRTFAATYYGRSVPGYEDYVARLAQLEQRFRARAADEGFVW